MGGTTTASRIHEEGVQLRVSQLALRDADIRPGDIVVWSATTDGNIVGKPVYQPRASPIAAPARSGEEVGSQAPENPGPMVDTSGSEDNADQNEVIS